MKKPRPSSAFILNESECGCLITSEFRGGLGIKTIQYCALHESAPLLAEALAIAAPELDALGSVKAYRTAESALIQSGWRAGSAAPETGGK